jgi:hypothetical protein
MRIPAFTAQASLYRTSNRYRSSGSEFDGSPPAQSVVAAYQPGPSTQKRCDMCLQSCTNAKNSCEDFVAGLVSWWNPVAGLWLYADCASSAADCRDQCVNPPLGACCPKACGPLNPSDPGEGCCDTGDSCCDGTCCPPNLFCYGGGICSEPPPPMFPTTPPLKQPTDVGTFRQKKKCPTGSERCGNDCCPPGLQCCDLGAGRVGCRETCVA